MISGAYDGDYEEFCLVGYVLWRDSNILEKRNFHLQDRSKELA
jgi:hypothetical protein